MMKKTTLLLLAVMAATQVFAASGTVTGRLFNAADSTALQGAAIQWNPVNIPTQKKQVTSVQGGTFTLQGVPYGDYDLTISFLGFKPVIRKVTVDAASVDLGRIYMVSEARSIDGVVIDVVAIRTSQKGDTVTYNADAFKVAKDADAEGLLSKLPGVTVENGQVTAQGEQVKKVFIDGKEFFGDDVTSAIKNLPAEAIAKIEVYNKLSDQAEFTGVNDGQGFKAINIVTRPDMRQGQFGKLYAGYGTPNRYVVGGNVNIFSGTDRWSLIGLSNNLNQQNFSSDDILGVLGGSGGGGRRGGGTRYGGGGGNAFMVPQQSGISSVNSFGVNYSGQWGKKVNVQGSYFFNNSINKNDNTTDRQWYTSVGDLYPLYSSENHSEGSNYNNRFNARIDYKINDNQSLMIRPQISFQNNTSNSNPFSANGRGISDPSQPLIMSDTLNTTMAQNNSRSHGYNVGSSLTYRIKLGKPGRTLSVDGQVTSSQNDNDAYRYSLTHYYPNPPQATRPDQELDRHTVGNANGSLRVRANLMYTEPITLKAQVNVQYRFSYNDQPADRRVYNYDRAMARNIGQVDSLSNVSSSNYITQSFGPGFNYAGAKTMATVNVSYQTSSLGGDNTFPQTIHTFYRFNNLVYFGMLNQTFSPNNALRIFLRSSTNNPSISQLSDVTTVSDATSASAGNPYLKPSYENNLYINYNRSMVGTGRTLMVMFGGSITSNYITDSLHIASGSQFTKPVNMSGYRTMRGMVSFGTPMKWMKCNVNVTGGVDYSRLPSYMNGMQNISSAWNYNGGLVLGSNISDHLDFTLRYNIGYNMAHNTINTNNDSRYLNQTASANVKWIFWKGITLAGSVSYYKYSGISESFTDEHCNLNFLIGKKVFHNQRGEFNVGIYDMLNQNSSFSRSFQAQYVENTVNSVIGRYVGFNFIYNLRNFGKRKVTPGSGNSTPDMLRDGMRMMMGAPSSGGFGGPPGGGGGMGHM